MGQAYTPPRTSFLAWLVGPEKPINPACAEQVEKYKKNVTKMKATNGTYSPMYLASLAESSRVIEQRTMHLL